MPSGRMPRRIHSVETPAPVPSSTAARALLTAASICRTAPVAGSTAPMPTSAARARADSSGASSGSQPSSQAASAPVSVVAALEAAERRPDVLPSGWLVSPASMAGLRTCEGRVGVRGSLVRSGNRRSGAGVLLPERLTVRCQERTGTMTGTAMLDGTPATADGGAVLTEDMEWQPPSWDEVVRLHSARVYRLAYRLTGNRHDAEDLTQEVFVRVFRSLSSYTPGTFEGWLHRITTNLFLDTVRRKARIRFEALPDDAERLASKDRGPAQVYDDTHLDGDVQRALDALPPDFRAAVVLCDLEGLSYEEIASTLGVKIGTVRSRIHRGRSQLRAALAHLAPAGGTS